MLRRQEREAGQHCFLIFCGDGGDGVDGGGSTNGRGCCEKGDGVGN